VVAVTCDDLDRFADGELPSEGAEAFRIHLGLCDACVERLEQVFVLDALVEETLALPPWAPGGRTAELPPVLAAADDDISRRRARRWTLAAVVVAAAAAAVALVPAALFPGMSRQRPAELAALFGDQRMTEGRLSYPGLDGYRPLIRQRGGVLDAAGGAGEQLLAALEERRDYHGMAVALLLEGRYAEAGRYLDRAAPSAAVLADGAALAIERGDASAALALAERALASGGPTPQALWNRAAALALGGSTAEAAVAFRRAAALGEPGWSDEARRRADELDVRAPALK
jgi:hypothetical protein